MKVKKQQRDSKHFIGVWLSEEELSILAARKRVEERSTSQVIRRALRAYARKRA